MSLSWVWYMRACSLFRFVLIELRHRVEPSAVLWVPEDTRAKPCFIFGSIYSRYHPFLLSQNYGEWSFMRYKNVDTFFCRFVTNHAFVRQTDRQTDELTAFSWLDRVACACNAWCHASSGVENIVHFRHGFNDDLVYREISSCSSHRVSRIWTITRTIAYYQCAYLKRAVAIDEANYSVSA